MSFAPNHQEKVNQCYPKKEGEGTVSGKLSSLIYYINARPQKLVKVATYLSVKVVKDVARQKDSYNEVTLDIVEAIMKNCSSYFETFCPFALTVLYYLLQSNSYPLASRSLQTFRDFCSSSKNIITTLHDDVFFRNLNELASYFSRHCIRNQDSVSGSGEEMWQSFGFQGLNLIIGLEDFKNEYGMKRVRIIIETVWAIMKNYTELLPASAEKNISDVRSFSESGQKAIYALTNLLNKSTATTLPVVIGILIDICDRNGWSPKSLCMFFFGSLASNVSRQFLFVVISSIFKHLEAITYNDAAFVSLLFCIYQILWSNIGPLGFSANELANQLLSRTKVACAQVSTSLPVLLSSSSIPYLSEPVSMCIHCLLALFNNNAFMTQKYDIIIYILRKNFKTVLDQLSRPSVSSENSFSDRHSIVTETVNPITFHFLQVIWIFLAAAFFEPPKVSKFSHVQSQSPIAFFDRIFTILAIDDRDTTANCLHVIFLMIDRGYLNVKETLRIDGTLFYLDQTLLKLSDCLNNETSSLPHFVLSYRILRAYSRSSKLVWINVVSMVRSLRVNLISMSSSRFVFCTFMECLLLKLFHEIYGKIDSLEYRDIVSELADCQVYVDLFEVGETSALNHSFGESHFEFDLDPSLFLKIYRNGKLFSVDEANIIIEPFSPSVLQLKEKSLRVESRQLSSFQDSFKSRDNREQDFSSKRSYLSLNLGSSSSRSTKITSPRAYTENLYIAEEDCSNCSLPEMSPSNESTTSINILSSDFDALSQQAKADKNIKSARKTMLE